MMWMGKASRKISDKEVEHIAHLARITISEGEKKVFAEQFNKILEYFDIINELYTDDIPPTSHVVELVNSFREDVAKPSLTTEEALKNAPKSEGGLFKAPKII